MQQQLKLNMVKHMVSAVTAAGSDFLVSQVQLNLRYKARNNNQWRLVRSAEDPENNDIAAAFQHCSCSGHLTNTSLVRLRGNNRSI
jgi:hypothetical protein